MFKHYYFIHFAVVILYAIHISYKIFRKVKMQSARKSAALLRYRSSLSWLGQRTAATLKPFYYQDMFETTGPLNTPFKKLTCKSLIFSLFIFVNKIASRFDKSC